MAPLSFQGRLAVLWCPKTLISCVASTLHREPEEVKTEARPQFLNSFAALPAQRLPSLLE